MRQRFFRLLAPRMPRAGMRHPDGRPLGAMVVVDVDLDTAEVTVVPPVTPFGREPEGVFAVVWHHGEPVGQVSRVGPPGELLAALPGLARAETAEAVAEHRVRDALASSGGFGVAAGGGPGAVEHPPLSASGLPGVTVAVCTRDRPEDLRRCLAAIGRLEGPVAEVLVVDNASRDDGTRAVVAEFPSLRYVREPRRGLDWARNRALLAARTEVVAFTDDDVEVHPGWVQGLLRAFAEEPAAVAVTGLVVPAELATPAQVLFEVEGGFGRGFRRQWFAADVAGGEVAARRHVATGAAGTGANTAVRREPALALGGFDPALDVGTPTGGCGDLEFYFRVIAAGHLLVYEPSAVVRHRHRPTMEGLIRQRRGDGTGSYSYFLGAGRHYGWRQYAGFLAFAARWALRHHGLGVARTLVCPWAFPPATRRAETAGALAAVLGRYHRRAERQAAAEAAAHPGEPTAPPLVRPRGHRTGRSGTVVSDVDLATAAVTPVQRTTVVRQQPGDVVVRVTAGEARLGDLFIKTRGSGLSRARLYRELARSVSLERTI